jgi:antitoxin component YwqK of YwqJK toxin-antitoxin module
MQTNYKKYLEVLSFIFLFTACQVSVKKEIKVEKYYPDGKVESIAFMQDGKKNGIASLFYPNGKLKQQGKWVNDKQEGIWTFYYEDGAVSGKINFVNDFQNGQSIFYFPNGNLDQEVQFKDGKPNGISKSYYRDINKVRQQSEWVFGKRNGIVIIYDSVGTSSKKYLYKDDSLVKEYK